MPRDAADALRQDRIRLTHMVESARRALRIASGLTAALFGGPDRAVNADEHEVLDGVADAAS